MMAASQSTSSASIDALDTVNTISPFTVACAVNNDIACHSAIQYSIELCRQLREYKLYFIYAASQNPTSHLPYIDHLQQGYNLEVHEEAKKDLKILLQHLDTVTLAGTNDAIEYEFVLLERPLPVGDILLEFTKAFPTIQQFVMGTHEKNAVVKLVMGSVSQYCIDYMQCPVTLVKSDFQSIQIE